jgi:hypothetical protein
MINDGSKKGFGIMIICIYPLDPSSPLRTASAFIYATCAIGIGICGY